MGTAGDARAVSQVGEACGLLAAGARGDGPSGRGVWAGAGKGRGVWAGLGGLPGWVWFGF